ILETKSLGEDRASLIRRAPMALQSKLMIAPLLGSLIGYAAEPATGAGAGDDGMGSDSMGTIPGEGPSPGGSAAPLFPTAHPRIYLTPNRARLVAALNAGTPAAKRFKSEVDQWVGGADIFGFSAWNAA